VGVAISLFKATDVQDPQPVICVHESYQADVVQNYCENILRCELRLCGDVSGTDLCFSQFKELDDRLKVRARGDCVGEVGDKNPVERSCRWFDSL
jgi:hypothetical protein